MGAPDGDELDGFTSRPRRSARAVGSALFRQARRLRPERFGFWVFSDNKRARRFYERTGGRWCLYETDGAEQRGARRRTRATSGGLAAKERKREARRPALALAQLFRAVDEHLDPGRLEPPPRLAVAAPGSAPPGRERQRVRPERLELLVRHLDQLDPELAEQLREPHRAAAGDRRARGRRRAG